MDFFIVVYLHENKLMLETFYKYKLCKIAVPKVWAVVPTRNIFIFFPILHL